MKNHGCYTDAELFDLLCMGNREAFDAIYKRFSNQLLNRALKRLDSVEDAREVVQDVFVQLYLKRSMIAHTENLSAYLNTLLRNKIIDRYREQMVKKKNQSFLQQVSHTFTDELPGAVMDEKLLEKKINNLIDGLPQKCREVFLLSRTAELSHHAISQKLQISVSTVEKHIGKALKVMRKEVGCRW